MPNADSGSRELRAMVDRFVTDHANARAFTSLGQFRYLSCMRHMDGVIGNSSSGLLEAPSFGVGTINIGDRQAGRLKATSVIDCAPQRDAIIEALERLSSRTFKSELEHTENPYGNGGASNTIVAKLREVRLEGLLKKKFHDMDLGSSAMHGRGEAGG
jgi:GDP/UDP-N,N'-diacetylbacillosamine 2-epimerase (hydrolysing)